MWRFCCVYLWFASGKFFLLFINIAHKNSYEWISIVLDENPTRFPYFIGGYLWRVSLLPTWARLMMQIMEMKKETLLATRCFFSTYNDSFEGVLCTDYSATFFNSVGLSDFLHSYFTCCVWFWSRNFEFLWEGQLERCAHFRSMFLYMRGRFLFAACAVRAFASLFECKMFPLLQLLL